MSSMKKEWLNEFDALAPILTNLRTSKNWTQTDVANKLNIKYQSYQAYERGVAVPTLQNFIKLADLYDVSLDYLIGRKEI